MKKYWIVLILTALSISAAATVVTIPLNVQVVVGTYSPIPPIDQITGQYAARIPIRMTIMVTNAKTGLGPPKQYQISVHWLDDPATTLPDNLIPNVKGGRSRLCHPPVDFTSTLAAGRVYSGWALNVVEDPNNPFPGDCLQFTGDYRFTLDVTDGAGATGHFVGMLPVRDEGQAAGLPEFVF